MLPHANAPPGELSPIVPTVTVLSKTLHGTTAWLVTVLLMEVLSVTLTALGLGVLTALDSWVRVGLGIIYLPLTVMTWILTLFVRDSVREKRLVTAGQPVPKGLVNHGLRVGIAATMYGLAVVGFVLLVAIPTSYNNAF